MADPTLFGIRGSKVGHNVSESSFLNFSIDSDNKSPKIWRASKKIVDVASYTFSHGLGYPPGLVGYVLNGGKYFLNYSQAPAVGNGFENAIFGDMRVTNSQVIANCTIVNALRYFLMIDPASTVVPANAKNPPNVDIFGIKISPANIDVKTAKDYQLVYHSFYQTPLIVQVGTLTVTLPQQTVLAGNTYVTNVVADFTHKIGYASHIIVFRDSNALLAANPSALHVGGAPPFLRPEEEISISPTTIRYRISGQYVGPLIFVGGSAVLGPMTFQIKFFITQVALP